MKILSIETSCDDTGVTIMEASGGRTNATFKILAHALLSQIKLHIPFGGVYPALAKREHEKNLPILLEQVLKEAHLDKTVRQDLTVMKKPPVDLIAVTYGPGLEMCLWEGIVFAKKLAEKWNVPLIPVDHMEGHIFSVFGKKNKKNRGSFTVKKVKTPALSLLVSGGHTQLVLMNKWMEYKIIGETLDDAVGEAFDKVGRMLGLPYPGGPEISKLAETERTKEKQALEKSIPARSLSVPAGTALALDPSTYETPRSDYFSFALPRPMLHTKNFNFSYSGLKTAVLYMLQKLGPIETIPEDTKNKIALEFENAAIECLVYKTTKAVEKYNIKTLLVGGGVSCNTHLQRELTGVIGKKVKILFPQRELSGDNALMIGIAGYLQYMKNKRKVPNPETIKADGNLKLS